MPSEYCLHPSLALAYLLEWSAFLIGVGVSPFTREVRERFTVGLMPQKVDDD